MWTKVPKIIWYPVTNYKKRATFKLWPGWVLLKELCPDIKLKLEIRHVYVPD